jgi:hypothetical protein
LTGRRYRSDRLPSSLKRIDAWLTDDEERDGEIERELE